MLLSILWHLIIYVREEVTIHDSKKRNEIYVHILAVLPVTGLNFRIFPS